MNTIYFLLFFTDLITESLTPDQARFVFTIIVLASAIFMSFYAFPYIVNNTINISLSKIKKYNKEHFITIPQSHMPWLLDRVVLVQSLQVITIGSATFILLYIWNQFHIVELFFQFVIDYIPQLTRFVVTTIILLLTYLFTQVIEARFREFSSKTARLNAHEEEIIIRSAQITLIITSVFVILSVWQVDLSGLLLGAGFLGIIVGFAAQKTLGSVISGLLLMFSRPFEIGDWVEISDHEGIVNEITIINTRLKNFDGELIIIPNEEVSTDTIINRSRQNKLRLTVDVGVDYNTDIDNAIDIAVEEMSESKKIMDMPKPEVYPKSFGDSAIILENRFWINDPTPRQRWKAKAAVVQRIKTRYEDENITIPFPQRVHSQRVPQSNTQVLEQTQSEEE